MEQPAPFKGFKLGVADPHHPPDVDRDLLDPLAMPRRKRIPLVNGRGRGPDRLVNISRISTSGGRLVWSCTGEEQTTGLSTD